MNRIGLAHLLRRAANRLDPHSRRISVVLTHDIDAYVRGMNRSINGDPDA